MISIFLGVILLTGCGAIGSAILRCGRLEMANAEKIVVGIGLGLLILANLILMLGIAGGFQSLPFWIVFGIFALAAVSALSQAPRLFERSKDFFRSWKTKLILAAGLIVLILAFMEVLTPETANDSLCYHLHLPKLYLAQGAFSLVPDELNAMYPILMEVLYAFGLGLSGVSLAKFFHLATGILTAGLVFAWSRQLQVSKTVALSAAVLFLTTPAVINQMPVTYVDVALTFFSTLLLYSIWKWKTTQRDFWLGLAGAFAGACISIKYLGALSVLLAFVIMLSQRASRSILQRMLIFCGLMLLVGGYWYIRNWILFGNPIYPYLQSVFHPGQVSIYNRYADLGIAKSFVGFLKMPWLATMKPQWFGGIGDQAGPAYLAFFPLALFATPVPFCASLLFFVSAYLALWFVMGQMLRFALPVLPILAVLISVGWMRADFSPRLRKCLALFLFLILASHVAIAAYHFRSKIGVAIGLESPENYLTRVEGSYAIAGFINQKLPLKAKILAADEIHLYYYDRAIVRDIYYAHKTQYSRLASPQKIVGRLLEDGYTHILYCSSEASAGRPSGRDFSISAMIERGDLAPYLTSIFQTSFESPDRKEKYSYVLYAIQSQEVK